MSKSVRKAVGLLDALGEGPSSLTELARATGTPASSVHRMLAEMESLGLVRKSGKTYLLGVRLIGFGEQSRQQLDVAKISREPMEALSMRTSETVHLGLLDGKDVVYIAKQEGTRGLQMASYVGLRSPAQTTAMGKCLIASLPASEWGGFANGIQPRTSHTVVAPELYEQELREVRANGYSLDREENELGIRCVAAPIRNRTGAAIAAISLSGATTYISKKRQLDLVPGVVECAASISRALGYEGDWNELDE